MRLRLRSLARQMLGLRSTPLGGQGRPHLPRDIGMDDWQGSIGTSDPDRLWPVADAARPSNAALAIRFRRLGTGRRARAAIMAASGVRSRGSR
jgi:hypothetical protein